MALAYYGSFQSFDWFVPVSYTHLDVYKRQPQTEAKVGGRNVYKIRHLKAIEHGLSPDIINSFINNRIKLFRGHNSVLFYPTSLSTHIYTSAIGPREVKKKFVKFYSYCVV